jgi:predicted transcriptional regulator of viral defense system
MSDRLDLRRRLHELAFRQAGYLSAAQALEIGYTYQAQKYHVDRGNWVRIDRGMFRLAEWPSAAEDAYARWTVWSEGRGVISFQSAADVHDLGDFDPGVVHLTLPALRPPAPGVIVHRTDLGDADVEDRGSFRVTTPTRTVLDLADAEVSQEQLTTAVRDALASGRVGADVLRRRMDDFGASAALRLERALASVAAASA